MTRLPLLCLRSEDTQKQKGNGGSRNRHSQTLLFLTSDIVQNKRGTVAFLFNLPPLLFSTSEVIQKLTGTSGLSDVTFTPFVFDWRHSPEQKVNIGISVTLQTLLFLTGTSSQK